MITALAHPTPTLALAGKAGMKRLSHCFLFAWCCWCIPVGELRAQSYTFTTIAGLAGVAGNADGTNSDSRFYYPSEMAIDSAGVLYVSDLQNHAIRKITPLGTNWVVATVAGLPGVSGSADGTNTDARFNYPKGVALDGAGNLFVADNHNHTIRKITPEGTNWVVTTIAGLAGVRGTDNGMNSNARFSSPTGIAVDSAGQLYVVDTTSSTIRGITATGTNWFVHTIAGEASDYGGFTDDTNEWAEFRSPFSVAVNRAGTLYVTDAGNNAIREIKPIGGDWVTTTIAGFSGNRGTSDGPGSVAMFYYPNGITVDEANQIFVTDQDNDTIRKVAPSATEWMVSTVGGAPLQRGTNDGPGDSARFAMPWGIAVDSAGNLFVADYLNHTIRKGVPSSIPAPWLDVLKSADQVVLSWPTTASNYVLETTGALDPGATWTPLTSGVEVAGNSYVFTNSVGSGAAFYRLRLH
jgi:hypothetical protein